MASKGQALSKLALGQKQVKEARAFSSHNENTLRNLDYVNGSTQRFLTCNQEEKTFSITVSLDSTGYKARVDF